MKIGVIPKVRSVCLSSLFPWLMSKASTVWAVHGPVRVGLSGAGVMGGVCGCAGGEALLFLALAVYLHIHEYNMYIGAMP